VLVKCPVMCDMFRRCFWSIALLSFCTGSAATETPEASAYRSAAPRKSKSKRASSAFGSHRKPPPATLLQKGREEHHHEHHHEHLHRLAAKSANCSEPYSAENRLSQAVGCHCTPFTRSDESPRILVTGGAGFVGSHLIPRLRSKFPGATIKVVDNLWRGAVENLVGDDGVPSVDFVKDFCAEDLTDEAVSLRVTKNAQIVFHLADIVAGVDFVFKHQEFVYQQNIRINTHVAKAAKANGVRTFLYTGTACSFPKNLQESYSTTRIPENKTYPANPESAYGWSKLMGEYELQLAKVPGVFDVGILRFHNLFGPGMIYDANRSQALPSLIRKGIEYPKEDFVVWGTGKQYRDFLYIDDAVEALMMMLDRGMNKGAIQVGTSEPTTLHDAAMAVKALVHEYVGRDVNPTFDTSKPEGDKGRVAEVTRAREILQWRAKMPFEDGLRRTMEWILRDMHVKFESRVPASSRRSGLRRW
jgi:GDP-D-mannose 3',5'-epimerase